jgi:multidrug efflux pump subunit AcrA (membrane-fusion protein)
MSASAAIVAPGIPTSFRAQPRNHKNAAGKTVVKVQSGNKVEEKAVTVGLDDGLRAEIVSGLNEGETVIVETKAKSSSSGSLF